MTTVLTHKKTGDSVSIIKSVDGNKNTVIIVTGTIKHEDDSIFSIINIDELFGNPKSLRLDTCSYLIEKNLTCLMSYKDTPYMLPFEGKGKFDIEGLGGVCGHEIDLTLKGTGSFLLVLDLTKLGV